MASTQILPFCTVAAGSGGNRLTPSAYAALTSILADGFQSGTALSVQLNTVWAQTSFMAAGLANFCVAQGISVPDDGNLTNLVTELTEAIQAAAQSGTPGRLLNTQYFSSSGTWTKPAGTNTVIVEVQGGGGGGGGGATTSAGNCSAGAGGSAGGYALKIISGTGSTETVTIGAGGAGVSGNAYGSNGGTSSFGAWCSATGGSGGQGSAQSTAAQYAAPSIGGTGIGGDINVGGQPGSLGLVVGSNSVAFGGNGGGGIFGAGGVFGLINTTPGNGIGSGVGGAGVGIGPSQSAQAGGNGTQGLIIVRSYS